VPKAEQGDKNDQLAHYAVVFCPAIIIIQKAGTALLPFFPVSPENNNKLILLDLFGSSFITKPHYPWLFP